MPFADYGVDVVALERLAHEVLLNVRLMTGSISGLIVSASSAVTRWTVVRINAARTRRLPRTTISRQDLEIALEADAISAVDALGQGYYE